MGGADCAVHLVSVAHRHSQRLRDHTAGHCDTKRRKVAGKIVGNSICESSVDGGTGKDGLGRSVDHEVLHGLEPRQRAPELSAVGGVRNRRSQHALHSADTLDRTDESAAQDIALDGTSVHR